ncbi:MAG: SMC-Scp complex subunit ScpB [Archaeoglobaceae archaeon]
MNVKLAVEAILFTSPDPLSAKEIAKILGESEEKILKAVEELVNDYLSRETALEVIKLGEKYLMRVKPEYAAYVEKLSEKDLDRGTLRTLAVIAVKQPITLSRLAKIRGNKCYEHVRKLKELGFVRAEKRGRSTILTTTKEFASYFGIETSDPREIRELIMKRYASED